MELENGHFHWGKGTEVECSGYELGLSNYTAWVSILALPLSSLVTWGKSLCTSIFLFYKILKKNMEIKCICIWKIFRTVPSP